MTTTTPNWEPIMIDRAQAEAARWRIAVSAFEYYPDKHLDEPGYTVDEDVAWCIEPLAGLAPTELEQLRATIRTLITSPSADRQAFIRHLASLTVDDTATEGQ